MKTISKVKYGWRVGALALLGVFALGSNAQAADFKIKSVWRMDSAYMKDKAGKYRQGFKYQDGKEMMVILHPDRMSAGVTVALFGKKQGQGNWTVNRMFTLNNEGTEGYAHDNFFSFHYKPLAKVFLKDKEVPRERAAVAGVSRFKFANAQRGNFHMVYFKLDPEFAKAFTKAAKVALQRKYNELKAAYALHPQKTPAQAYAKAMQSTASFERLLNLHMRRVGDATSRLGKRHVREASFPVKVSNLGKLTSVYWKTWVRDARIRDGEVSAQKWAMTHMGAPSITKRGALKSTKIKAALKKGNGYARYNYVNTNPDSLEGFKKGHAMLDLAKRHVKVELVKASYYSFRDKDGKERIAVQKSFGWVLKNGAAYYFSPRHESLDDL